MDTEYLYVLDFGDCTINCLHLYADDKKYDEFENTEELLKYWGFNPNNCQWMFSNVKLELIDIITPLNN